MYRFLIVESKLRKKKYRLWFQLLGTQEMM